MSHLHEAVYLSMRHSLLRV